jgi:ERCC4-related helicase
MNAVAKTPKIHRSDLLRFVHKPELIKIPYSIVESSHFPLLAALHAAQSDYDLETDPWVVDLLRKQRQGLDCSKQLQKVFMGKNTYCAEQLKKFASKAQATYEELGHSATDWYIHQCIWKFEKSIRTSDAQLFNWDRGEKEHLLKILKSLPLSQDPCPPMALDQLSPKVQKLINVLIAEAGPDFTGLVFAEQRIWVAALAEILSVHPQTRDFITIGTFVGTSQSSKRKGNMADLVEVPNQQYTLDDFRTGKKNIILSTSVLEEGIDISSCHLVVCFERPKNLKSFIQRRGRARKQKSKYFIFQSDSTGGSPQIWESLEAEMKAAYLNDLRQVKQAEERESIDEQGEMYYKVSSTG